MGLLARLFGRGTKAATPAPDADFWYNPATRASASGQFVTPESALRCSMVFACCRVLGETIAGLPLNVHRHLSNGGNQVAAGHPVYDLIHTQPNAWQTAFEFKEMAMWHLCLRGNAYAEIIPGPRGFADQLWPLHPDYVTVKQIDNGRLVYDIRDKNGAVRRLTQDQMLHIKGPTLDGIVGLNPIAYHRETIGKALASQEYGARFFANDARPGGLLRHPGKLSDSAKENLKKSWDRLYSGTGRGTTAVMEEGMDWVKVSMTNEDAQYLESIQASDIEIARLFRVPGVLVNVVDKAATYASAEQFFLSFTTHTVLPWCIRIEQAMEKDLILAPQAYYIKFNLKGLMRGDMEGRFSAYRIGREIGVYSANEIRALEEMNPREDGGGNAFLEPLNMGRSDHPAPPPPKQPSGLVNGQGQPLEEAILEEWELRTKAGREDIAVDLNAYGKGLYTNGHARHQEHQ